MSELIKLFLEFFYTGLFAVGGGMATFPFLQNISERYPHWFTANQLIDMIAVSESTPGPIGVNCATYAGNQAFGLVGGIVATIGLIAPSIIIIIIISKLLNAFKDNIVVQKIFYGIRPASTAMIGGAGISVLLAAFVNADIIKTAPLSAINWFGFVLAIGIYFAMKKWKKHPVFYILVSAVIGIAAGYLNLF